MADVDDRPTAETPGERKARLIAEIRERARELAEIDPDAEGPGRRIPAGTEIMHLDVIALEDVR